MKLKYKVINFLSSENKKNSFHKTLSECNNYYFNLSEYSKQIFIARTIYFIKTTRFRTEKGFQINDKMKVTISSAFVQITFGLKTDALDYFSNVFIAPKPYSYNYTTDVFLGDVNPYRGQINLSWPAVEKGFKIPDDGINLSIHEFGHCIIIENTERSRHSKLLSPKILTKWENEAGIHFNKMQSEESSFFRKYGGTNKMEFFSVALEEFFERPVLFLKEKEKLYKILVQLLNQNPIEKNNPVL